MDGYATYCSAITMFSGVVSDTECELHSLLPLSLSSSEFVIEREELANSLDERGEGSGYRSLDTDTLLSAIAFGFFCIARLVFQRSSMFSVLMFFTRFEL